MASNLLNILIKGFFFIFLLNKFFINSFQILEKYPKALRFSSNRIFLVTENGFRIYDLTNEMLSYIHNFTSNERKIISETEAEMTSIAVYSDDTIIALVKKYLYVFNYEGNYLLEQDLNDILIGGVYFDLIATKKEGNSYYYFISYCFLTDENKGSLAINYCFFSTTESITNPLSSFSFLPPKSDGDESKITKNGLSCVIMTFSDGTMNCNECLTCFYLIDNGSSGNDLGVTTFGINDDYIMNKIDRSYKSSPFVKNIRSSAIKLAHKAGESMVLICYTYYDNSVKCVRYKINDHQFSSEFPFSTPCKTGLNGMEAYYFDDSSSYMIICSDSSTPKELIVSQFNSLSNIAVSTQNYMYGGICDNIYSFNIININDEYKLINDCVIEESCVVTGIIDLDLLNEVNNYPDFNNCPIKSDEVITETSTESKEEIISNIENLIKNKNPKISYVINGNDYMVIIKPINKKVAESTVNIDFSGCEKILKEKYPEKQFRILQINMENNKNKNILVDQVEYKIYDENEVEMDLSICNDVNINIEYEIKNKSLLNIEQMIFFQNMGVDVFNLNHEFFNDICFPYSDKDSNSDMILYDRVKDIYQNYSICGDNCEYISFNIERITSNCNCKVKQEVKSKYEKGNFKTYVMSAFLDSNFGVIKCYNLVFSFSGKLENAGFLIFATMIFCHIPIYFLYFINGVTKVTNYIKKEMDEKGYNINNSKNIKTEEENLDSDSKNIIYKKRLKSNPPKKKNEIQNESNGEDKDNNIRKHKRTKILEINKNDIKKHLINQRKIKSIKKVDDSKISRNVNKYLTIQNIKTIETNSLFPIDIKE